MKLNLNHTFLRAIARKMHDIMYDAIATDETSAAYTFDYNCGSVDVEVNCYDDVVVNVVRDADEHGSRHHCAHNIATAIEQLLPSWEDMAAEVADRTMDDYQYNGFSCAASFYAGWLL